MNKRGFTLPELLVIIAIIGILAGTAITAVNVALSKTRLSYYEASRNSIKTAAQKYYNDNRVLLPAKKGETGIVTVQTLVDFKYLDKLKDHTKKDCDQVNSKVIVTRKSSEKYDYKVIIKCNVSEDLLGNEE